MFHDTQQMYKKKIAELRKGAASVIDLQDVLEMKQNELIQSTESGRTWWEPGTNAGSNRPSMLNCLTTILSTCEYFAGTDKVKKEEVANLREKLFNVVKKIVEEQPKFFLNDGVRDKDTLKKSLTSIFPEHAKEILDLDSKYGPAGGINQSP